MSSIRELTQTKAQLEEALSMVNEALASEEYAKPFSFKLSNPIRADEFKHDVLKQIIDRCESRQMGFDPNLTLQHIEHEVLDQFNEVVKLAIKGKSIPNLMAIRHELELFMLTDRKKQHEHNLKNVTADLERLLNQLNDEDQGAKNSVATIGPDDSYEGKAPEPISTNSVAGKKKKG